MTMVWIIGEVEGPQFLSTVAPEPSRLLAEEVRYGGFLCSGIDDLVETIERLHERLLIDFESGWSAVGFTLSGSPRALGPWAPPTSARAHRLAPMGLYLLSRERLCESLAQSDDARAIHRLQPGLGPVFCDPLLELRGAVDPDPEYRPPSRMSQTVSALRQLTKGAAL